MYSSEYLELETIWVRKTLFFASGWSHPEATSCPSFNPNWTCQTLHRFDSQQSLLICCSLSFSFLSFTQVTILAFSNPESLSCTLSEIFFRALPTFQEHFFWYYFRHSWAIIGSVIWPWWFWPNVLWGFTRFWVWRGRAAFSIDRFYTCNFPFHYKTRQLSKIIPEVPSSIRPIDRSGFWRDFRSRTKIPDRESCQKNCQATIITCPILSVCSSMEFRKEMSISLYVTWCEISCSKYCVRKICFAEKW